MFRSQFANTFLTCRKFTSLKSRIALQVARKIVCDRVFNDPENFERYMCVNSSGNHTHVEIQAENS